MMPWLAAAACLTLVLGAKAVGEADSAKASPSQKECSDSQASDQQTRSGDMSAQSSHPVRAEGAPTQCNKASGILGMDVRNQKDERLGHIKDLVIDWKNEQVSYAVINTASKGLLGMGGKLLAVPLTALTASSDHSHLILNADKERVEAATGFDANNWPSVHNPSWGAEPFWQAQTGKSALPSQPAKALDIKASPGTKSEPDSEMDRGEEPD